MLTEDRYAYILKMLNEKNTITVQELIDQLNHSESTIRRDLTELENQDRLVRIHGGARRKRLPADEASMEDKTVKNTHEKQAIARKAIALIEEHEVVFLDAGSTTYEMIPLLADKDITVVTNGVPHAARLADYQIEAILIGGRIKKRTKAVIGSVAADQLGEYHFTKAFLGMNGVDPEAGFTTPDVEEAAVKKKAIRQSNATYVLADPTKFNEVTFAKVADIDDCAVITTSLAEEHRTVAELTKVIEVNL